MAGTASKFHKWLKLWNFVKLVNIYFWWRFNLIISKNIVHPCSFRTSRTPTWILEELHCLSTSSIALAQHFSALRISAELLQIFCATVETAPFARAPLCSEISSLDSIIPCISCFLYGENWRCSGRICSPLPCRYSWIKSGMLLTPMRHTPRSGNLNTFSRCSRDRSVCKLWISSKIRRTFFGEEIIAFANSCMSTLFLRAPSLALTSP